MVIPASSDFPTEFDTNDNLFVVHDALRVTLIEDYEPGDTSITIRDDNLVIDEFPPTGIITLTEQCSDPELRGTSFFYGSHTDTTFDDLELIPGFTDTAKPKRQTNVTMNVFEKHHNAIKDAVIATEEFIGIKGLEDTVPGGSTLVGRVNFLRRLVLRPRAWFSANTRIGIVPVTVTFTDESFRGPTSALWEFGDGDSLSVCSEISPISQTAQGELTEVIEGAVPCGQTGDNPVRTISHTYTCPGKYDVTLTVANQFGIDSYTISEFFVARAEAPDEATISISPTKAAANTLIELEVVDDGEQLHDPITEYTWNLGDDLTHKNSTEAVALYTIGGIYDISLRTDTTLGAYRITKFEDAINIMEQRSLFLLAFDTPKGTLSTTKILETFEFGLLSETFKSNTMPSESVTRDFSFTSGFTEEAYQRDLFLRNSSFARKGTATSGGLGQGVLYWAEDSTTIKFRQMEPFNEVWTSAGLAVGDTEARNWNWVGLNRFDNINIIFGVDSVVSDPTDISLSKSQHALDGSSTSSDTFIAADFVNGADELLTLPDSLPATYRTDSSLGQLNHFIARNESGPGPFFRFVSFYRTEGDADDWTAEVRKLVDIPGTTRTELEIATLAGGVYAFNNSGEVARYDPNDNTWSTGGPGIGSAAFRCLQDLTVAGHTDLDQTFRVASDRDRRAYLSFDYSTSAFVKFNEADLTFSALGSRPTVNEQFLITIF